MRTTLASFRRRPTSGPSFRLDLRSMQDCHNHHSPQQQDDVPCPCLPGAPCLRLHSTPRRGADMQRDLVVPRDSSLLLRVWLLRKRGVLPGRMRTAM